MAIKGSPMSMKELDLLCEELDRWRARFDHLRVQANLGKRELADKLQELGERLEPAQRQARERLTELARGGASEARTLASSLQAGWDELRRTHRDLASQAESEEVARRAERRR